MLEILSQMFFEQRHTRTWIRKVTCFGKKEAKRGLKQSQVKSSKIKKNAIIFIATYRAKGTRNCLSLPVASYSCAIVPKIVILVAISLSLGSKCSLRYTDCNSIKSVKGTRDERKCFLPFKQSQSCVFSSLFFLLH